MSLDPLENRLRKEAEAEEEDPIPPLLNQPFPFKFISIDLQFYDLLLDPPILDKET